MRNSPKYLRTSATEVESGEPRLTKSTELFLSDILGNFLGDTVPRNDRIAQRNSIASVPGKKQSRRIILDLGHAILEPAITNFVLRNGLLKNLNMLEHRLAMNTENRFQIFDAHRDEMIVRLKRKIRIARAADITSQRDVAIRRTIREERRREQTAENVKVLLLRN